MQNEAYELSVGSPFDFETSVLLYIANDIPEPSDRSGHQRAIEQGILNLCIATGGKTLVLFTSYDQLKRTYTSIKDHLSNKGHSGLSAGRRCFSQFPSREFQKR